MGMTFAEAADAFNAAHPDSEPLDDECPDAKHNWSDWGFNHAADAEIRFCATCGIMDQQWIAT